MYQRKLLSKVLKISTITIVFIFVTIVGLRTYQTCFSSPKHPKYVGYAALSSNGKLLATGHGGPLTSKAASVIVWEVDTGKSLAVFSSENGGVDDLKFSPDGSLFAVAYSYDIVELYNTNDYKLLFKFRTPANSFNLDNYTTSLQFSPSNNNLIVETGQELSYEGKTDEINIWDTKNGALLSTDKNGRKSSNHLVRFTPDGKISVTFENQYFRSNGVNHTLYKLHFWQASTGQELGTAIVENDTLLKAAFSSSGKTLTSIGKDFIKTWDLETFNPIVSLPNPIKPTEDLIALSPDATKLFFNNNPKDYRLTLFDVRSGQTNTTLEGPHMKRIEGLDTPFAVPIMAGTFSADSRWFAELGDDGIVNIWDLDGYKVKTTIHSSYCF